MKPTQLILGFMPLIVYGLVGEWVAAGPAALIAFAATLVVIVVTAGQGGVKILPAVQAVVLAVIAVIAFSDAGADHFLSTYGRSLAGLAVGIFILTSLPILPFTTQFSRAAVPPQYRDTAAFRAFNRKLSRIWGLVIMIAGAAHAAAAFLSPSPAILTMILRVGVPAVAVVSGLAITRATVRRATT